MLKKSLLLIAVLGAAQGLWAETLTPDEALRRLEGDASGRRVVSSLAHANLAFTQTTAADKPAVYVFNRADQSGFVMVSADDVAVPLLGYTDSGAFNPADIPPQFRYWLNEYADQIAYANREGLQTRKQDLTFPSSWKPVTPYIKTNWDQRAPYNLTCPEFNGQRCPTGCVATAMAQVMKYWEYPKRSQGQISYYSEYIKRILEMDFSREPEFAWDDMLDNYVAGKYTEAQGDAVANLMKQCGYAVQMWYYPTSSGTQTELVAAALINYFGYSKGVTVHQRLPYSASEWNEICYNQLKIGPVIYGGIAVEGGHCFVMDGYDGNGYFHFNWGWSGTCNGYYLLDALNPTVQGTGGYFGGYNMNQVIIAGVQPQDGQPLENVDYVLSMTGSLQGTYLTSSQTLALTVGNAADPNFANDGMYSFQPILGLEVTNADGTGSPYYIDLVTSFPTFDPGTFLSVPNATFTIKTSAFPDGNLKLRLVYKKADENDWKSLALRPGNFDYVIFKKIGSSAVVTNMTPLSFSIPKASLTTPLYYNNPCVLEITATNDNSLDLTQSLIPFLYTTDGAPAYMGDNRLVTVGAKTTQTFNFNGTFQRLDGAPTPTTSTPMDFKLVLVDYVTGKTYGDYGVVTMKRSSSSVRLTSKDLTITNAEEQGTVDNVNDVFGLNDFSHIGVSLSVTSTNGFIATPLTAIISEYDPQTGSKGAQVMEQELVDMIYLEKGDTKEVKSTLNFSNFDPTKMYALSVYYTTSGSRALLGSLIFAASSGVQGVIAEADGLSVALTEGRLVAYSGAGVKELKVYDAGGALVVMTAGDSIDISSLGKGLYIAIAADADGNVKTIKFIR